MGVAFPAVELIVCWLCLLAGLSGCFCWVNFIVLELRMLLKWLIEVEVGEEVEVEDFW